MKKVILIASPNDFAGNVNVSQIATLIAPPMGILAVGSFLAAHGVPVELVDVQMDFGFGLTRAAERLVSQRVAQYLRAQADDIAWIGISELSNSGGGIALAQEIHTVLPDIPIVFGGYFPSSTYRLLLEAYPFIAAIVRGDGEATALQISQCLSQGRSFLSAQMPNLAWRDGDEIHSTPIRPVAVDDLPIMDFWLLRHPDCYQIIDLMTSRGCPFRCNYCLESAMRPYVAYSPEWVDRQLTHLQAVVPNERLYIYDPVFGVNQEQTLKLCRILGEHRFNYGVESRVDVLSPDLIAPLRQAGMEMIFWGIESANVATLLRMNKVSSAARARRYVKDAVKVLETCFENDVTPCMGIMLGFPGDSEADYQTTLEFVEGIRQFYERITAQTGVETGYGLYAFYTKVYTGSPLEKRIETDFPEIVLRSEPFIGEKTVISPSPEVDLDTTRRYQVKMARQGLYTPLALERTGNYHVFSLKTFLDAHPELMDDEGVITFGDSLRRFSPGFDPDAMLMRSDKVKESD